MFSMIKSILKVLKSNLEKSILELWCNFNEQELAKKERQVWPELGYLHLWRTQRNLCALESIAEMKQGVGKCWSLLWHISWFPHPPAWQCSHSTNIGFISRKQTKQSSVHSNHLTNTSWNPHLSLFLICSDISVIFWRKKTFFPKGKPLKLLHPQKDQFCHSSPVCAQTSPSARNPDPPWFLAMWDAVAQSSGQVLPQGL